MHIQYGMHAKLLIWKNTARLNTLCCFQTWWYKKCPPPPKKKKKKKKKKKQSSGTVSKHLNVVRETYRAWASLECGLNHICIWWCTRIINMIYIYIYTSLTDYSWGSDITQMGRDKKTTTLRLIITKPLVYRLYHDDAIKWAHFSRHWPLCGEFTGHRWIPFRKASDTELWCFLWSTPEQRVE